MNKMKNLIILGLVLIVLYLIWRRKDSCPEMDKCRMQACKIYTESDLVNTIDDQLLRSMSEAYAQDLAKSRVHSRPGNARTDTADALSIVFDIEQIKALIYLMERKRCENSSCDPGTKLGIRYYYIKYPDNLGPQCPYPALNGLDKSLRNKHSLAMVPAYFNTAENMWKDYYPRLSTQSRCFPEVTNLTVKENNLKSIANVLPQSAGENHGGMAPPPPTGIFGR